MPRFVDQEMFNMLAVTALKISTAKNQTILSASEMLASHYSRSYQDSNLRIEIHDAAEKISGFLSEALPNGSLGSACTQMQFCIKHYKLDGSKKRRKILGGVWFSGEKQEVENKVMNCAANIITYHMLVVGGTIPIAPKGWSL